MGVLFLGAILVRLPSLWHEHEPYLFCDESIFSSDAARMLDGQVGSNEFRAGGLNTYPVLLLWKTLGIAGISDPGSTAFLVSGRLLMTVVVGSMAVVLIYLATRLVAVGRLPALAAGAAFIASPYVLATSRYWYPDHYLATFGALALYASLLIIVRGPSTGRYLLLGAAWGLAASTKYSGVFLIVTVLTVVALVAWRGRSRLGGGRLFLRASRDAALASIAAAATFAIVNWSALINPAKFVTDFRFNLNNYANNGDASFVDGLTFNVAVLALLTMGLFGTVILVAGLVRIWRLSMPVFIVLASFPLALAVYLATNPLVLHRNLTIAVAPVFIAFGVGFASLARALRTPRRFRATAAGVVLAVTIVSVIWADTRSVIRDFSEDARVSASEWVRGNIPDGSSVGTNEFCSGASPADGNRLRVLQDPNMEASADYYLFNMYWKNRVQGAYHRGGWMWWMRDQRYSHFYEFGDTRILPRRPPTLSSLVPKGYRLERVFSGAGPDVVLLRRV